MTKVKISQLHDKKYSHAYRFTNSTTADFGFPQPLCCRLLYPKGTIKGSLKQFVRLSAMPRPTFGDVVLHNIAVVVPIEDVYPAFISLMKEQPYTNASGSRYIPRSMPYTTNSYLWSSLYQNYLQSTSLGYVFKIPVSRSSESGSIDLMPFSEYLSLYQDAYVNKRYEDISITLNSKTGEKLNVYNSYYDYIINALYNGTIDKDTAERLYIRNAYNSSGLDFLNSSRTRASFDEYQSQQASFDYQVVISSGDLSNSQVIGYRLTSIGKALRKIYLGLGFNPSRDDGTKVNILPLLAYYKAWYDRFVPYRDVPFTSSIGYTLIRYIEENPNNGSFKYNSNASTGTADYFFTHFISDGLCSTYATQDINFLSLHMRNLTNNDGLVTATAINDEHFYGSPTPISQQNPSSAEGSSSTQELKFPNSTQTTGLSHSIPEASAPITGLTLKLLQRMYSYVGRDSLIGNRIELWAKSHLDSEVYNTIFRKVSVSSSNSVHIQIGDIDATAGTRTYGENNEAQGNLLGDYAGKGIGTGELTFKSSCGSYAYFIVLSWVDVNTSVYQGTDAQLFALTKYEVPQAEFDALGYEITPRSVIWADNDLSIKDDTAQHGNMPKAIDSDSGFGYVPRYSGFKYAKNIVNGDMSLRSLRNSMNCYYADREILSRSIEYRSTGGTSSEPRSIRVVVNDIPQASTAWRYVERYPWLSSYDRMFVNSAGMVLPFDKVNPFNPYTQTVHDDNFYIHCVFDITENTPLRPLSESFDTKILKSDESTTVAPA